MVPGQETKGGGEEWQREVEIKRRIALAFSYGGFMAKLVSQNWDLKTIHDDKTLGKQISRKYRRTCGPPVPAQRIK